MTNSTRRALRTGLHVLLAVLSAVPLIAVHLPSEAWLTEIVVASTALSKLINHLEDSGALPVWLKDDAGNKP